jgi:hypothetical protein
MDQLNSGDVLAETFAMLRRSGIRAGIALFVMTVAGVVADLAAESGGQLNLLVSAAFFGMQYWLTRELLDELELKGDSGGRVWQMFGVCFLTNLGILLGFVLLIIPGVFLLVRWSLSVPHVLADDEVGVIDSIGRSWEDTGADFWAILIALLVFYVPAGIAIVATGLGIGGMAASIPFNLFVGAGAIGGWHVSVAVFAARRPTPQLAETFA